MFDNMMNNERKSIFDNITESFSFVDLDYSGDKNIEWAKNDMSWENLVQRFSTHEKRQNKDGRCFMPVMLKPRDQWVLSKASKSVTPGYRNDSNVDAITMAVIDLDMPGAKEDAEKLFSDYEYIIYSTHSYSKETPYKYRIVLKLQDKISRDDWPNVFRHLTVNIDADKVCGNLSRIYYWPSIPTNSEIEPYFSRHPGKAISKENIIAIGKDAVELEVKKLKEKKKLKVNKKENNHSRHFTGKIISRHTQNKVSYTYENMCKRHINAINNLAIDDSRHNFALKVTAREIGIFGRETNLFALTQFLFRAGEENSTKSLLDGNTATEILGMIESAFNKYTDAAMDDEFLYEQISQAIEDARFIAETKDWDFPDEDIVLESKNDQEEKNVINNEYSYDELRSNHLFFIKQFVKDQDAKKFASSIISNQWNKGSQVNPNHLAKFIYYCFEQYYNHYMKGKNIKLDSYIDLKTKEVISLSNEDFPEDLLSKVEKMPTFWKVSCMQEKNTLFIEKKSELSANTIDPTP